MSEAIVTVVGKRCTSCKQYFPADSDHFNADGSKRDGLHHKCRVCHRAASKKWNQSNREVYNARMAKWKRQNPDKTAVQLKRRREREVVAGGRALKDMLDRNASYSCEYCGIPLGFDDITLDHRVPIARGGQTTRDNIVVACKSCNSAKGAKSAEEFVNARS